MAEEIRPKRVYRFRGRTMTDAARRARLELGEDTALLDVRTVHEESGEEKTEIVVGLMDRVGIPSLIEFLTRPSTSAQSASTTASQEMWPARFRRVLDVLIKAGVREDQATILCREAMEEDSGLDATPWEIMEMVLERLAPCSPPLDLSVRQVFGLAGDDMSGRTTVAQEICRMAAAIVPDRILLITEDPQVVPEAGYDVSYLDNAEQAQHAVSLNDELRVVVIDLPAIRERAPNLGYGTWMNRFGDLVLIPVVDGRRPLGDAVGTIRKCAEHRSSGWILTGLDDDARLGMVLGLAMASGGPLGVQGLQVLGGMPRLQLARWKTIFDRLRRQAGEEPGAQAPPQPGEEGR
jgi:hypothetical protein